MRIYTLLTGRSPAALTQFAQTCVDCGATGVTIITRPEFVAAVPPPGQTSLAQLAADADSAAAKKDYRAAAAIQERIDALKQDLADQAKAGAAWISDAIPAIKPITQLVVLGNLHWPGDKPFNAKEFFSRVDEISATLTTTGVAGIVQTTPLLKRTYIPLADQVVAAGSAAQGDPVSGGAVLPVESPGRHRLIPKTLTDRQAEYAEKRLGLDRGGLRRSKHEAGNMMGFSQVLATRVDNEVVRLWPEIEGMLNENSAAPVATTE